jgi:hypothetical protein
MFSSRCIAAVAGVLEHEGGRVEFRLACPQIVDHAIDASVEAIAGRKKRAGEQLLIGLRKRRIQYRVAVGQLLYRLRRNGLDGLSGPKPAESDRFDIVNRGAGDNPVIIIGKILRHHHSLPATSGAADEIGAICLAAVKSVDQVLGSLRRDIDRTIGVIDDGLGIEEELGGVRKVRVLMSAVLARRLPCRRHPGT